MSAPKPFNFSFTTSISSSDGVEDISGDDQDQEEDYDEDDYYQPRYMYEELLEAGLGVSIKGLGIKLNSDEDAVDLLNEITHCNNLKFLELEGNSLGIPVSKSIAKLLESHPELEVALWKDLFTGRLKDEIPKALQYLLNGIELSGARLQRLDLSDNAIGPVGMAGLAPFFRSKSSFGLKELVVSNEGLGPEGGTTFATALIKCHELSLEQGDPFQLKVFICGQNRLENKAATKFAEFFSLVGSLEEIHLPQNGINPPGIRALSAAFKKNPNLRVLNLNDNTIRADGAQDLGQALATLVHLEELNLGDCLMKNEGVTTIINSIPKKLSSLLALNFESNELTKEVGLQIANMLTSFPSLVQVQLGSNEFGVQTMDEMTSIVISHSNSEFQIDFEDDCGSGCEDEDDQEGGEGDENYGSFKEEGGDGDGGEDEEGEVTGEHYQSLEQWGDNSQAELENQNEELSSFLADAKICSPDTKTGTTATSAASTFSFAAPTTSNNNLFTFGPTSSFSFGTPTFGGLTTNAFGSGANTTTLVEEFIKTPTFQTYMKLTPDAGKKVVDHLQTKFPDKAVLTEESILTALAVSNIVGFGVNTQECFNDLMVTALKSSSANTFITTVLSKLGLIHAEDKRPIKTELVTDATIKALAGFLGQNLAPIVVLRCAQEFFNPMTPAANPSVKIPGRENVLDVVNRQLALLN